MQSNTNNRANGHSNKKRTRKQTGRLLADDTQSCQPASIFNNDDQLKKLSVDEMAELCAKHESKFGQTPDFNDLADIYVYDLSDAQILDSVSLLVDEFADDLSQLVKKTLVIMPGRFRIWAMHMLSSVAAAREAARRCRWYGLKSAPGRMAEKEGHGREPMLLDLYGFSGRVAFSDGDLLSHICDNVYGWRTEIQEKLLSQYHGQRRSRMLELLSLCEKVCLRDGTADEALLSEMRCGSTPTVNLVMDDRSDRFLQAINTHRTPEKVSR